MSSMWQYPHVNLFKQFGVGQWKKCSKEGDVSSHMDRDIKATVYRISGSIPSSNYIQLPKSSSQSLNLTGQYIYVLFKPLPAKYFVVHFEVVNDQGMVIRISFSNLFKEFKATSTWLQFPFVSSLHDKSDHSGPAALKSKSSKLEQKDAKPPVNVRWTLLSLDLKTVLSRYLHSKHAYLKNVKLCSNLLVKNVFTSDMEYSPLAGDQSEVPSGGNSSRGYAQPLPREMSFLMRKGQSFVELYDNIRFPAKTEERVKPVVSHAHLKGMHPSVTSVVQEVKDEVHVHVDGQLKPAASKVHFSPTEKGGKSAGSRKKEALTLQTRDDRRQGHIEHSGAKENLVHVEKHHSGSLAKSALTDHNAEGLNYKDEEFEEVHVYAERGAEVAVHREVERGETNVGNAVLKKSIVLRTSTPRKPTFKSLEPDPIMKLSKVIGFGGHTTSQLLFSGDDKSVVYPCHSIVVDMDITSGKQRFFIGHTDKVSCLSINNDSSLLASGQTGSLAIVRVWQFTTAKCLSLFKTHHCGLHTLSFSHSGAVLCGVGKDRHGKSQVVVWNTARVASSGEVGVLAKAHTDASIERMRVAAFDDSRMVSCGWDNIRFWRVRGGSLRSCPVNLEEHHQLHFTDVMFQPGYHSDTDLTDRNVYACTKNGYLFEVHYKRITVRRVWNLLSGTSRGVAINALHLHEAFCVTGSEDGLLRVWPLDFSAVFMEAEHDGSVDAVSVSQDGLRILVGTCSGNIGLLDASTRRYTTLMRSHTDTVLSVTVNKSHGQLITCSRDCTIRVWDLVQGTQLFDFRSTGDMPKCVSSHPTKSVFACGFTSGAVRVFHTPSTKVLAEHKSHTGVVTGLIFSPSGDSLYSSTSNGSLALYDSPGDESYRVTRVMGNTVVKGERYGPRALTLNVDGSRLAFIGPSEFTITVLDAKTLHEVLRLDIISMAPPPSSGSTSTLDSAQMVLFSPQALNQLLVVTSGARLIKFSATNGQLLSEVSNIHHSKCTSLAVDRTGKYLVTGGDKTVKVWDYSLSLDLNFQVFIGHSSSISQVQFTPLGSHVISCGDAVFIWEFLGPIPPLHPFYPSTPPRQQKVTSLRSASPRKRAPAPLHFEPLKMQSFTPVAQSQKLKSHVFHSVPIAEHASNDQRPSEDNSELYGTHSESQDGDKERQSEDLVQTEEDRESAISNGETINRLQDHSNEREDGSDVEESSEAINRSNDSSSSSGGEDVQVQQDDEGEIEIVMKPKLDKSDLPGSIGVETPPPPYPPLSTLRDEPVAQKHCRPSQPSSSLAQQIYVAPPIQAGMERKSVLGLSGNGRNNVCWLPSKGLFVYSNGCIVVIEDLSNGKQRHLTGHKEEVSTLAVQHSGSALASASPAFDSSPCEIRIWKITSGKCTKVLTFHSHCVGCMAFSKDDRFLLSVATYQENSLAVWSCHDYSLLAATTLQFPVHDIAWDPHVAYEFTAVGGGAQTLGVSFWMVEESKGGKEFQLKVHEPSIPTDLLETHPTSSLEFTSLTYGAHPHLFIGTTNGMITIWDTTENRCLLYWRAEPSEISTMISNASQLVTGNVGGALQLWSMDTAKSPSVSLNKTIELDGAVFSSTFDSNMELGVLGTSSGSVWYVNWSDLSKVKLITGHVGNICGITFTKDGTHFASCSLDGLLSVWNVETLEQIVAFQASRKSCTCVAFAPLQTSAAIGDNEQEYGQLSPSNIPDIVAGYSDGTVRIFNINEVKIVRKMQPHASTVTAVMYSFDGYVIISGCTEGIVAISNASSGLVVRVVSDHQGAPITDLHSSSTAHMLLSLGVESHLWLVASGDRRVSIWTSEWRRDSGCQLVDWLTFPGPASAPDGTRLKKAHKCQYDLLPPSLARFSPMDPDVIVYTGYGLEMCVQFYSISKKSVFRTSGLTHWPTAFDISPQGHLLAFGCQERVVKLMDFEEGSFQDYAGNYDRVSVVVFSPLGNVLISACGSSVQLWNITLQ